MSILDTFFVVFESDTSKLDKGMDDAKKSSDGLKVSLSETDKAAGDTVESVKNLIGSLGGFIAAGMTLASVVSGIKEAADFSDALGKMSDSLGVNIKDVSAWGEAVSMSGGSAAGFQGTLKSMTNDLQQVALTGQSQMMPFLARLGIGMFDTHGKIKNVTDLLPELASKFEGMSKAQSMTMGKKLGLDEGTIMLLQQGRAEVDKQVASMKALDGVTKENAKVSADFHNSTSKISFAMRGLFLEIGTALLPALTWLNEAFTSIIMFLQNHKDFAIGLFTAIGTAITVFLLPPLISAGIAAAVAMAPFLLIGAIVAGVAAVFALLYDDVMNFIEGNDSLIGQISQKYPIVGEIVHAIVDTIKELWKISTEVFGGMAEIIMHPLQALQKIEDAFKSAGNSISQIWGKVIDEIKSSFNFVDAGIDKVKNGFSAVKSFFGIGDDTTKNAKKTIDGANSVPLNNITSSAISNMAQTKSTNVTVGKVEVHTQATDAEGISKHVGATLQDQIKTAVTNFDDGIHA